jgi:hypothetical protein
MPTIELSTVAFYKTELPSTLSLRDYSWPLRAPAAGVFSALYGHQSKQDGLMAASDYAKQHQLEFTVIDFWITLEHKLNPLPMQADMLQHHDFMNLGRTSRPMDEPLKRWMREYIEAGDPRLESLDTLKLAQAVTQQPALAEALLQHPVCQHLKILAYPALTGVSDRPLSVGSVPLQHWGAIHSAECRLNSSLLVTLEPHAGAVPNQLAPAVRMKRDRTGALTR